MDRPIRLAGRDGFALTLVLVRPFAILYDHLTSHSYKNKWIYLVQRMLLNRLIKSGKCRLKLIKVLLKILSGQTGKMLVWIILC